jgi:RNA polymerase sigma-70 factor (ECF subfamily)
VGRPLHQGPASSALDASRDGESDVALVQRIAAGDRAALEHLYRGYHPRVARFLRRSTRRADIVGEAINDTFWIVWQKAHLFRAESRVSTWVMGIAWRCVMRALRRHGDAAMEIVLDDETSHPLADPTAEQDLRDWVGKGLARLPVEQRVCLELAYGGGHSLEEIAAIMDCPVTTVKSRLFHARSRLREMLPRLAGHGGAPRAQ